MASTGSYLRELRARHGVSLEHIAQTTRINQRFLEALEADDLGALPAGPFARGFIRSYCQALSESADEPLALLPLALPARARPPSDASARPRARRSLAPVLVSLALLVILGAALAAVTVALRSGRADGPAPLASGTAGSSGDSRPAGASPPAPGRAAESRPPGADAPPSLQPPAPARLPASSLAAPGAPAPRWPSPTEMAAPYRLVARASEATWMRVRMEGGRTTEETIPAGEAREWISNRPFELRIGNAGGVSLELNGQPLPPLGAKGAVILSLVVPAER